MKYLTTTVLAAAAAFAAAPALAQSTDINALFPTLTVTEPSLTDVGAIITPGTGLFSQISTSVASPAVAIMTPATIATGGNAQLLTFQGSAVSVVDPFTLNASPVYVAAGSLAEPVELYADGFGGYTDIFGTQWTNEIGITDVGTYVGFYSADVVAPAGDGSSPVTLTGVTSLTNLSAAAYNSLTFASGSLTGLVDPTVAPVSQVNSQVAVAFGSGSAAELTLPIVTADAVGVAISNTALGAVNSITVTLP